MSIEVVFKPSQNAPTINPNIYGHFAEHLGRCIYEGFWVGKESEIPNIRGIRKDVVEALKALDLPVLRWPGGCFADEYHWKDGIGPREDRPAMINTHWGGVTENNHFGTHEFFDLCEQLETKPYVCGNVGSGSVQEMMEWVEYMTSPADSPMANLRRQNGRDEPWELLYFGVGNENWGCGGNMRAEFYCDQYLRYNTFVKNYTSKRVERIAGGANTNDFHWTEVMMDRARGHMDGLSLHNYTLKGGQWPPSGSASNFEEDQWISILKHALSMDELIGKHSAVMEKYDPERKVGLVVDEWGTWFPVEPGTNPGFLYQQNSMLDALVAAVHFHIFHRHADRVTMANIAQTVNVLQAMILTDGPRMLRTPTYWVFEMFKEHQGAQFVPVEFESPSYRHGDTSILSISVSGTRRASGGVLDVTLANLNPNEPCEVELTGVLKDGLTIAGRILTSPAMQTCNTFENPDEVSPVAFESWVVEGEQIRLRMPARSIVHLVIGE